MAESKMYTATSSNVKFKRRREYPEYGALQSALSKRLTRLSKSLKASNPTHVVALAASSWSPSTTGTIVDVGSTIQQGDDYFERFGNHVDYLRAVLRCQISPGGTAATVSGVRISILRGISGFVFAANMTGSYNPIVGSTITRCLYDKFFSVAPANATQGYPTDININLKLKHRQKFTGGGAGTTTGESIYVLIQSDKTAGTTAPQIFNGVFELFFKP